MAGWLAGWLKTQPYEAGTPVIPIYHPHQLRFRENKNRIKDGPLCEIGEAVMVSLLAPKEQKQDCSCVSDTLSLSSGTHLTSF